MPIAKVSFIKKTLHYFTEKLSGVAHGEDLNYFFRMSSSKVNVPAQDILTRQRLVTMWYNFATQGYTKYLFL